MGNVFFKSTYLACFSLFLSVFFCISTVVKGTALQQHRALQGINQDSTCDSNTLADLKAELIKAECLASGNTACVQSWISLNKTFPKQLKDGLHIPIQYPDLLNKVKAASLPLVPISAGFLANATRLGLLPIKQGTNPRVYEVFQKFGTPFKNRAIGQVPLLKAVPLLQKIQALSAFTFVAAVAIELTFPPKPEKSESRCGHHFAADIPALYIEETKSCEPVYNIDTYEVKDFLRQTDEFQLERLTKNPNTCSYYKKLISKMFEENNITLESLKNKALLYKPRCEADGSVAFEFKQAIPQAFKSQFRRKTTDEGFVYTPAHLFISDNIESPNPKLRLNYADNGAGAVLPNSVDTLEPSVKANAFLVGQDFDGYLINQYGPGTPARENIFAANIISSVLHGCCQKSDNREKEHCVDSELNTKSVVSRPTHLDSKERREAEQLFLDAVIPQLNVRARN